MKRPASPFELPWHRAAEVGEQFTTTAKVMDVIALF
jgi:hypothetical protein